MTELCMDAVIALLMTRRAPVLIAGVLRQSDHQIQFSGQRSSRPVFTNNCFISIIHNILNYFIFGLIGLIYVSLLIIFRRLNASTNPPGEHPGQCRTLTHTGGGQDQNYNSPFRRAGLGRVVSKRHGRNIEIERDCLSISMGRNSWGCWIV